MQQTRDIPKTTYTKLTKGNLIIMVPDQKMDRHPIISFPNKILWSLTEFEGKVFSEMDVNFVLKNILQQRLLRGESIYDIEISLYDETWIDENFEAYLKAFWGYYAMKQIYRYYDNIVSQHTGDQPIDGLIAYVGWDNNTRDSIGAKAFNRDVDFDKGVMFSSYTDYTEELFEDLITEFVAKCSKLNDEYSYGSPTKEIHTFISPITTKVEVGNAFFLFREDKVYCGLLSDEDIICESSWQHYINEVYQIDKDQNNLVCTIKLSKNSLRAFTNEHISDVPKAIQKVLYSTPKQIFEIIKICKDTLYLKYSGLEKIYFTTKYIQQNKYIVIILLDKNWEKIGEKEIEYESNIEYFITNHMSVTAHLSQ